MIKKRKPLQVVVTWDDAVSEPRDCVKWDWTHEGIAKIGETVDLVRNRGTMGYLGYVDADKLILFKDFDSDGELANSTTIWTGCISKIEIVRGRTLFTREHAMPKPKKAKTPLH